VFLLVGTIHALTLEEVSSELVCQCGCGLVLNNCNHSDCGVAIPMRETIAEKLGRGETKEQITAFFVAQYGEVVLSSPTKKGFNLTVWILPFVSITVGLGIIAVLIVLWTRKRRYSLSSPESSHDMREKPSDKYEKILERELEDFD
jgi:cytochrome c-type biogenesis protein CcmH